MAITRPIGCPTVLASLLVSVVTASAQQAEQRPPSPTDVHEHVAVTAPALTPTRETTGTAWLPAATPMYGAHLPWRGWDVRLDGAAFAQFIYEPNDRHRTGGASRRDFSSVNWGMATVRRPLGRGRFGIRTMVSLEPWTIGDCGSLNLLATGEVCQNDTIHDRQQPHDTLMELAVDYERPLRQTWRWQVYAGLAGDPALGAPGYTHRASAMANPVAPTTHHWLDGTHGAFGVITAGIHNQRWKVEASVFNGREPDAGRVDLDLGAFDSVAARVSFLPTDRVALQVSTARLREARRDFLEPSAQPATKLTGSLTYHRPLGATGVWATTVAVGRHHARETIVGAPVELTTWALMAETSRTVSSRHTLFGRAEIVEMPAHHLHASEFGAAIFTTAKLQIGYVRHLSAVKGVVPGFGATASLSLVPDTLAPRYGGNAASSLGVFFHVRPARHAM